MSTVRKVQSKANIVASPPTKEATRGDGENEVKGVGQEVIRAKKKCYFCKSRTQPHYFDSASLRKFISDRGRILPRGRSGACAKHQRHLSREIKRARILALLPFSPHV